MLKLSDCVVLQVLHEDQRTVVDRGTDAAGRPVMLKTPAQPLPGPRLVVRRRAEHDLLASLDCAGVPRPLALIDHERSLVRVLEDIGGLSLDALIAPPATPPDLRGFFEVAIALAETLECIHRARIVHRDISPGNIIVHPQTRRVQLVDFGLASRLTREQPNLRPADRLYSAESFKWAARNARHGMRCKAQSGAMPRGIASICNAAGRPYRTGSAAPISMIQWTKVRCRTWRPSRPAG